MTIARSITVQLQQLISVEFLNLCSSASLVVPLVISVRFVASIEYLYTF